MFRHPFAWEVQVRRELLEEELAVLRDLPHAVWREMTAAPRTKDVRGRDERLYRITISARWLRGVDGDIEVTLALARATGWRRKLMRQTFVVTPRNTIHA